MARARHKNACHPNARLRIDFQRLMLNLNFKTESYNGGARQPCARCSRDFSLGGAKNRAALVKSKLLKNLKPLSNKFHNCLIIWGLSSKMLSSVAPKNSIKNPSLRVINSPISMQPPTITDTKSAAGSTNSNPKSKAKFVILKWENLATRFNPSAQNWLSANFN